MKQNLKGFSNLTQKLLTVLIVASMSTIVSAADNTIYIDQAGDFSNITINQDGSGNQVRSLAAKTSNNPIDPAIIRGDKVNVNINQTGANNKMNLGIDAQSGTSLSSVNFTYSTVNQGNLTGSNNIATFQLGNSGNKASDTVVTVTQLNGGNTADVSMLGSDNQLTAIQSGGGATLISTVDAAGTRQDITTAGGSGNSVTTNLTGDNGNVYVKVQGATNTIDIIQSGSGGATGHVAWMDINGTGNSVTLSQTGSANANLFNLKLGSAGSAANSNTYNITQKQ